MEIGDEHGCWGSQEKGFKIDVIVWKLKEFLKSRRYATAL